MQRESRQNESTAERHEAGRTWHLDSVRIAVKERKEPDHIELVSMTIKPGEEVVVGQRLRAILGSAQKKKSAA